METFNKIRMRFAGLHIGIRIAIIMALVLVVGIGISAAIPNAPAEQEVVTYPTNAPYTEFQGNGDGEMPISEAKVAEVVTEAPAETGFTMEIVYDFTDTVTYTRSYETGAIVYTNTYNSYVYKVDADGVLVWTDDPSHPLYAVFQP